MQPYSRISADQPAIQLQDRTDNASSPLRPSLSISDDSDDDIVYRDNLEDEPFPEKHSGFEENHLEDGYRAEPRRLRPRKKSRKVLTVLVGVIALAATVGVLAGWGYSAPSYAGKGGNKHITMDHIFNGTFAVDTIAVDWVKEALDGTYSIVDEDRNILLKTVRNDTDPKILVESSKVTLPNGDKLDWSSWSLSADMEYVLFQVDRKKQWRHSSHANYYIYRLSDSLTFPITPPTTPPKVSKCIWAPVGHSITYVHDNNIYVIPAEELGSGEGVRVTEDGSDVVFNGVPDWVYEEEVVETDSTMWWSPDGNTLAYLRMNEEKVKNYRLQYYNPSNDAFTPNQYTSDLDMKYPKPGTPIPLVTVHTFSVAEYSSNGDVAGAKRNVTWRDSIDIKNRIISEVNWVSDTSLLVKEVDRAARSGNVVLYETGQSQGNVVRKLGKDGEEGDDGWIDHGQNVRPLKGFDLEGYVDIVPNESGFNHLALFTPLNNSVPIWLTSGDWEVTEIAGVNAEKSTIYFVGANPSIDRHVYSATLPAADALEDFTPSFDALTNTKSAGYFDVSFSPGAGHYLLSYRGPEIPYQRLIEIADGGVDELVQTNDRLNATLSEYMRPLISRSSFESDGNTLNMLEILPPGLDTSGRKRYPVLIKVYGGPGSQTVHNRFERDWHAYLACEKKYVIIAVDGRGTGFKGRGLRNPVMDNLGHWEVVDQIKAAAEVTKRGYIDSSRVGIWGWSYGGYMTLKTLEADSGVFTLGMAVAPVTNWLYYDSVYTERYMSTPELNPDGYLSSAVNNVSSFGKVDFLWAHGSGDDNVHYANTASLLDKLTQEKVRGWRFRMFTDSNHNMDKRGAYRELYEWMTAFLDEKWGRGGTVRHG